MNLQKGDLTILNFRKAKYEEFLVLHVKRGTEPTYFNEKNKEIPMYI